ncbi:MAG TPA: NUDIX hydrolase [Polyangia bacterium]|jgi:MoaA/NifB/PqqE/SkfB family radical SAM enzyme|nr:NUDIX hydrolase [Polyangia bacterium]
MERVRAMGFSSVTAFADSKPHATDLELADQLGVDDVAAVQLVKVWAAEAEKSGHLQEFARSLLVRRIRSWLPNGWGAGEPDEARFLASSALVNWEGDLPDSLRLLAQRVMARALGDVVPYGWLPSGPDDPILSRWFEDPLL